MFASPGHHLHYHQWSPQARVSGDGIQKNQETFGKDVMIVFAGRTSMQAGARGSGRLVRWLEDDYLQVAKESPACKYVMPSSATTLRFAASSTAVLSQSSAPSLPSRKFAASPRSEAAFITTRTTKKLATWRSSQRREKATVRPNGALGQNVWMNGIPYTVIGTMKPKDQNSSYDGSHARSSSW